MEHSNSEKLLIGTHVALYGSNIKAVKKHSENVRVIELENGKTINLPKSRIKSFVDAQLRQQAAKQASLQPSSLNAISSQFRSAYATKQSKVGKGR